MCVCVCIGKVIKAWCCGMLPVQKGIFPSPKVFGESRPQESAAPQPSGGTLKEDIRRTDTDTHIRTRIYTHFLSIFEKLYHRLQLRSHMEKFSWEAKPPTPDSDACKPDGVISSILYCLWVCYSTDLRPIWNKASFGSRINGREIERSGDLRGLTNHTDFHPTSAHP